MSNATNEFLTSMHGRWQGPYSLWLQPGTPEERSESIAEFRPIAGGVHTLLEYGWQREGQDHLGALIQGACDGDTLTLAAGERVRALEQLVPDAQAIEYAQHLFELTPRRPDERTQ